MKHDPFVCHHCEVANCKYCDGNCIEGWPCECAEANHYDMLDDEYDDCDDEGKNYGRDYGI